MAGNGQRYSTLQDLDAGRETEIEMFSGAVIRMAKETGVPCPYNEVVYDLIKALEDFRQNNDHPNGFESAEYYERFLK